MKTPRLLSAVLCLASSCRPTAATCIDASKINPQGICTLEYDPVCGCDGKTYANACAARNAGVRTHTRGACAGPAPK